MTDVVCGVVKDGERFLITQRGDNKNRGLWEFPGGKVINEEHPFESIKRELLEELEIVVNPIRELIRYPFKNYNLVFVLCEPVDLTKIKLNEHLDFCWVKKTDFHEYNFLEGDRQFVLNFNK